MPETVELRDNQTDYGHEKGISLDKLPTDFAADEDDELEWGACCCCCKWKICCLCACILKICDKCSYWTGIKCCCCHIQKRKLHLYLEPNRTCTDVPCGLGFIAALVIQAVLFATSFDLGADPRWLVYYSDWNDTICAPGEEGGTRAAWPDIRIYDIVICVNECNETLTDERVVTPSFDSNLQVDVNGTSLDAQYWGYKTVSFFNAYCLPDPKQLSEFVSVEFKDEYNAFANKLDSFAEAIKLALNDLEVCMWLIIGSAGTAFLTAFGYGLFMRYFADVVIWGSIAFTIFGIFTIAYYMVSYSEFAYAFGYDTVGNILLYGGYCFGILDCMLLLAVCFMWNRIRLAIALSKETSRALQTLWHLFFYPIIPFLVLVAYVIYWLFVLVYIGSVTEKVREQFPSGVDIPYFDNGKTLREALGDPQPDNIVFKQIQSKWQYAVLYHIWCGLWVFEFIHYHTYFVIAGVYCEWYFADWKDKEESVKLRGEGKNKLSRFALCNSVKRSIYHFGSIAFGAVLIATIEFIEICLTYFEKKFISDEPSPIQKAILAGIRCCLRCARCILDRINKNGYIIMSIYGWPFCASSMKGIQLMFMNIIRAGALDMVSGYLEKLGKLAIISFNVGLIILIANYLYGEEISSLITPALVVFIISLFVAELYIHLYEVGLQSIFICFLIDEDRNKGSGRMRASRRLCKIIGETKIPKKNLLDKARSKRTNQYMSQKQRKYFASQVNISTKEMQSLSQASLHIEDDDNVNNQLTTHIGDSQL